MPIDTTPITRRRLIAGAATVGVVGAATTLGVTRPWQGTASATGTPIDAGRGKVVLLTLYGGNDGLNTVIPYTDSAYHAARPDLGYAANEVLDLNGELGLSPKLPTFRSLWDQHRLAVIAGVGYDNPSLSHFESMDIWQTANLDGDGSGWLGRWLDGTGHDPMRAISVGATLPTALRGTSQAATAVTGTTITLPGRATYQDAFTQLVGPTPSRTGLAASEAGTGSDLLAVKGDLDGYHAGAGPSSGASDFGDQLLVIASLLKAGAPTRVYQASLSSFDTHSDEKADHERMLSELDAGVSGFYKALAGSPVADDVVLLSYSEFGRRVQQNASGGTDHGTAAPMFVIGNPVKGGRIYGEQPSLTRLDPNGNLVHNVDFRSVYATVLDRVLGVDPTSFLGGRFPTLDVI